MSEGQGVLLGHFTNYRCTDRFWNLESNERRHQAMAWAAGLRESPDTVQLYLTSGIGPDSDILVWTSAWTGQPADPAAFFRRRAAIEYRHRAHFAPGSVHWGLTRPSEYSRSARSSQEVDPFAPERAPYLVAYPFTKTPEWYLLARDVRQGMMNEHIRIGKQYREITQLLLYAFGLQDHEFMVVYETHDLSLFSRLVHELRDTEARRYTRQDTPVYTGVHMDFDAWLELIG